MNLKRLEEKLVELVPELLLEKKKTKKKKTEVIPKAGNDASGKLHELLTGYHLNGGRHMERFMDKDGESPEEAHDRIKKTLHPKEYARHVERARQAAEDLKSGGHIKGKIIGVRWTSKPGDTERATGIAASQQEDASDIVITTKHKKKVRHHGVSLKASEEKTHHVGTSNFGLEVTYGGRQFYEEHQRAINRAHPVLATLGNKKARKAWMKDPKNAKHAAKIREANLKVLHKIAHHTGEQINKRGTKGIQAHIRDHILKTNMTPMERHGHVHIRHTSYVGKGGARQHHTVVPSSHWEPLLRDHKNLKAEVKGTTIHFSHKGKVFATHRMKFESQNDPLGTIKGFGNSHGDYAPPHHEKRKAMVKRVSRRVTSRRRKKARRK